MTGGLAEPSSQPANAPADDPALLEQFLLNRDAACPQCDYNLRNLRGNRCPECGEVLVLRVNVAEPRQGLLIAGLVALAAGAGLNGLLLIYMAIQILRQGYPGAGADQMFFVITTAGLLVEVLAMLRWISSWRRIRRKPRSMRIALFACCCVLTLADILIFSFTIR